MAFPFFVLLLQLFPTGYCPFDCPDEKPDLPHFWKQCCTNTLKKINAHFSVNFKTKTIAFSISINKFTTQFTQNHSNGQMEEKHYKHIQFLFFFFTTEKDALVES